MELDWISARHSSVKWGNTDRRVQAICKNGQIEGVMRLGRTWLFPKVYQSVFAKPFVKWAGGKGQLLKEIRKKYPSELGGEIN